MKILLSILLTWAALALSTAWPLAREICSPGGGVFSVKLKPIHVHAEALCKTAHAGPWRDVHHLFAAAVTIGTPPKKFELVVDTSSAETWVTSLPIASKARHNRTSYVPSESTNSEYQYQPFTFHNGEGATGKGSLYADNMTIAEVMVEKQFFGVVTSFSHPFKSLHGDGVLALPPCDIKFQSFVDNAFEGEKLSEIVFALYLPRKGEGELTMGGVNITRYTGKLTYIPVSFPFPHAWQITIEDITHRGQSLGITLEASIDTTASTILLDKRAARNLYRTVLGAKRYTARRWTFPCHSSPDFSIMMNGVSFKIPKSSINLGPVVAGGQDCVSAIMSGAEEGHAILGLAFVQNYYTVFDKSTYPHRVGFAPII